MMAPHTTAGKDILQPVSRQVTAIFGSVAHGAAQLITRSLHAEVMNVTEPFTDET